MNEFGKGRAYLVGTFMGHALPAYHDARNAAFLATVLKQAGISPDNVGRLKRRRRVLGNQAGWFFFNQTEQAVEEEFPLDQYRSARDLLGEELSVSGGRAKVMVEPLDIRCLVLEA